MEITCSQMDVLLSFYIEGDLSKALKTKVEEHLKKCAACRAKYEIVKTMIEDLKSSLEEKEEVPNLSCRYKLFQNNLSAYIDNELSSNDSVKLKKYTLNNKQARKELEDTYHIRKLMNDSFNKTKLETRQDFSKKVMKQLNPNEEYSFSFHPVLKLAIAFVITVLVMSSVIVFSLTLS